MQYMSLPVSKVPSYTNKDRVDHWWVKIFNVMAEVNEERPKELELLVKYCCTLAHGNAFLERGMGLTKRVVQGRSSLSDRSVKAQKVVKQMIIQYGGVIKVPITSEMLNYVRKARSIAYDEKQKEKKEAEKKSKDAAEQAEISRKRKEDDENKKVWQEKKQDLEENILSSQLFISKQETIRKEAMEKALKQTTPGNMKTYMHTAKFAAEAADTRMKLLNEKQAELSKHMGKKPRL